MLWMKSLNTKLLIIVVLFVALSGLLIALWQGRAESSRLQQEYDQRLENLSARYRTRIVNELEQRHELLAAARDSLVQALQRGTQRDLPVNYQIRPDADGAYRRYLSESGVFIHRDTEITAQIKRQLTSTDEVWLNMEPLLKSQFSAFYLISEQRVSRIWPASLVAGHRPDHDVTQEIFYQLATPENNPARTPRWTPIYFDEYPEIWTTSLLEPMYLNDEFVGVMGADIEMSFLFDQLSLISTEFEALDAFIFSADGELILRAGELSNAEVTVDAYKLLNGSGEVRAGVREFIAASLQAESRQAESRQNGAGGEEREGVQVFALGGENQRIIHQKMPDLDWYVSVYYPDSILNAKHNEIMAVIYKNILGMVLFLVLVLYYGLKWLVTDRILNLAQITGTLGASNWSSRVPEKGQDEISQLSRGINRMLDKINELFLGLNHNIRDMERLAYYDQLTGLQNRLLFKEQLRSALRSAERERRVLALLYLDLDHFKDINDSLGHEAGDQLLIEVAQRLKGCLRDEDSVARLGGDEFAILLRHVGGARYVSVVANKIIDAMSEAIQLGEHNVVVGVSIGVTLAPDDSEELDTLMKNADLAMYQAKYRGRNAYQFYTPEMNLQVEHRLRMERELRQALIQNEFELYYQPQFQMTSRKVVGIEALIRWNHPSLGLVSPDQFIPIAEDSGLIIPIGRWVLRTACQQARNLQKAQIKNVKVSINVSARQLNDRDFVCNFKSVIAEARVDPTSLVLEVTESTLMADAKIALEHLHAVRALGVGLAIDDFGTGYSSLSYLKRLPVNTLKVDRSFVQDLPADEEDRAITALIVAMANSLKYQVIVEGVENEPQLQFLSSCGCDYAQGFYFARPMPVEQVMLLLFKLR